MRQTKHQARRKIAHHYAAQRLRNGTGKLQTGGALYADHYTGKVHYVEGKPQGGGFDFMRDIVMPIKNVAEDVITTGMQIVPMFL